MMIDRDRLRYDLASAAWTEAHLLDESCQHLRHMLADICQADNIDRIDSLIDLAMARLPPDADERQAHEYALCWVMAEWLSIVHPPAAGKWRTNADGALAAMQRLNGSYTRRLPPF